MLVHLPLRRICPACWRRPWCVAITRHLRRLLAAELAVLERLEAA
jgi:hypothetical protein